MLPQLLPILHNEEQSVFGRVTPRQKQDMVKALQGAPVQRRLAQLRKSLWLSGSQRSS